MRSYDEIRADVYKATDLQNASALRLLAQELQAFDSDTAAVRLLGHPLLLFRVRRRARRQIRAALGRAATPVLVYQMGKVASKSIVATLAPYPQIAVFFAHYLVRQRLRERCARARRDGRWQQCVSIAEWGVTHELLFGSDREIKIVTLVREPIGRNISAFFQGLDRWTRVTDAHINVPMVSLIETFHRDFLHGWPLAWFDEEFRAVTGIDVYGRPFPAVAGHQRISQGRFDVLIMRHDLADSIKGQCLSEFLGIPGIEIVQDNRAEDKTYFDRYRGQNSRSLHWAKARARSTRRPCPERMLSNAPRAAANPGVISILRWEV